MSQFAFLYAEFSDVYAHAARAESLALADARGVKPSPGAGFSPDQLPRTTQVPSATLKQLQEIEKRFAETVKAHEAAEKEKLASETQRATLEAQIVALQAEIATVKKANQA